jgi:hypothetical protein
MRELLVSIAVGAVVCIGGVIDTFAAATELLSTPLFSDTNLKAYWRFEDNFSDSKGSNTFTNSNGVSSNPALFGKGADFGSSNSSKTLSCGNLGISGTGDISISFWYKRYSEITGGVNTLCSHTNAATGNKVIQIAYVWYLGAPNLEIYDGSSNDIAVSLGTSWHHIVFIRDVTVTNRLKLYLDGNLLLNVTRGSASASGYNAFTISGDVQGSNPLSGIVDDVSVFDRVLTSTEISNLYNGFATPTPTTTPTGTPTPEPTNTPGPPGTPGPGTRYTLSDIYDYLNSGTTATITGHTLEPPSGAVPGDIRFKTLNQIYEDIKAKYDQCNTTAADVKSGQKFFCTQPGSWGVQIGTGSICP